MPKHRINRTNHSDLGGRLREIREDFYGKYGSQFMADAMGSRSELG
jgi:hypothetical protein